MSSTKSSSLSRSSSPVPPIAPPSEAAKDLQTKLHVLLTQLGRTSELIKNWPESDAQGDTSNTIHVETTAKLIASIKALLKDLQQVEGVIQANATLRKELQECPVPINLLDLLDHGDGLNPDCFSRGLLKEALGQLGGLKRRKLALEMLGAAVQEGLDQRDGKAAAAAGSSSSAGGVAASTNTTATTTMGAASNNKRKLKEEESNHPATTEGSLEPAAKKVKTKA